jgi:large subunit ribosomal protein L4
MANTETTKKLATKTVKAAKPVQSVASEKPKVKIVKKETVVSKTVKKTTVVATENKTEAKVSVKEATVVDVEVSVSKEKTEKKADAVSIDVFGLDGKVTGKVSLPGEMFGEKVNKALLAQAVRVYLANQRQGNASTKTRGEVDGSTAKIYRQKGTGRARHGSKRAPIFVKGGVVFGPKPRDYSLSLPQKMKRKALFIALSAKVRDNEVTVIGDLGVIEPKTKVFAEMLRSLKIADKKQKLLFVVAGKDATPVLRAGRNVRGVSFIPSRQVNTYKVLAATRLVMMKESIDEMKEHFLKK